MSAEHGGLALARLPYIISDFSSFCGDFSPKHILIDTPSDQKSRWLSDGNKPPQYVLLKLTKPAIVQKIYFGKYEKSHPCNIQKLLVYGGLDPENTALLLEGGLNNDSVPEMLDLQSCVNGQHFPSQYIKIVPVQSWGISFNFSIWHVQLWGTAEETQVEDALANLIQFREREAVRLCLKHLRQYDYSEAFEALQKKSKILLEDPILTQLHHELVTLGNFEGTENTVSTAVEKGFFDSYISQQSIRARWSCIKGGGLSCKGGHVTGIPDMRGGHQICMDQHGGQLYLCGGWDGTKELSDLWSFSIKDHQWTCISHDTSLQGGPGSKSCYTMCFDSRQRVLYVLGGYVEASSGSDILLDNLPCEFYMYIIDNNEWQLITDKEGGPRRIYDHQMCYDSESGLIYVLGGRMVLTNLCSGLYVYNTVDRHWLCLSADQSHDSSTNSPFLPRSGHVMLFHPKLSQLLILGGQRDKEILSDMLTYDVRSGEISILADGRDQTIPMMDVTLRAAMDLANNQICLTGCTRVEMERETKESTSLWLYNITSAQWSRVMRDESAEFPVSRYAHSFVCDSVNHCYYMFGGNPGANAHAKNTSNMRLDDFWKVELLQQSKENLLRECRLALRKQRFIELSSSDPVEAVMYLQTSVADVVDHNNLDESREYRELTSSLFSSEYLDQPCNKVSTPALLKMRKDLYDRLATFFPLTMSQPKNNLIDFVRLS